MDELLTPIVYVLAIGGVAGYFIGYLIKKLSHLALTIGVFAFLLIYMVYTKAIDLNLDELVATITKFANVLGPLGFATLASSAPFVGSFVVGLVLGLRRG
ncbi:MAG: FUN14 domain-containing protein [Candidatus Bathyarchaeota archaeon]|nr:FUN14 domain-containing protein [Candidatus Bathyarchaeota archaeon]MDH5635496.1 FUN14 domain-containing protein [Candidatus Bathyarchaeota archaeon]MDH5702567.1 FUN14 domain-containing protein [Candidatus Bathyarchaeota archaeon]